MVWESGLPVSDEVEEDDLELLAQGLPAASSPPIWKRLGTGRGEPLLEGLPRSG